MSWEQVLAIRPPGVTRIGVSGHIGLSPATRTLVRAEFATVFAGLRPGVVGLSSLAAGTDQIFAEELLNHGGELTFVNPCARIEESFDAVGLAGYRRLVRRATATIAMPFDEPSEEAYEAAGRHVADGCDILLAVWDGEPARGRGGTADIVAYARTIGRPVVVIWPEGAARG